MKLHGRSLLTLEKDMEVDNWFILVERIKSKSYSSQATTVNNIYHFLSTRKPLKACFILLCFFEFFL